MPAMSVPTDPPPATSFKPCVICGKHATERFRPFCCRRCADVDLNRWLKGVYAVPVAQEDEDGGQKIDDGSS